MDDGGNLKSALAALVYGAATYAGFPGLVYLVVGMIVGHYADEL